MDLQWTGNTPNFHKGVLKIQANTFYINLSCHNKYNKRMITILGGKWGGGLNCGDKIRRLELAVSVLGVQT